MNSIFNSHFSSESTNNASLMNVDLKKLLEGFRDNLDSSGEIGKLSFYSVFIIYVVAIVVGLCGNILIVTAVLGRKRMRTARNVFIVTLALSDLILCIFTMPSTLWEVSFWPNLGLTYICITHQSLQTRKFCETTMNQEARFSF